MSETVKDIQTTTKGDGMSSSEIEGQSPTNTTNTTNATNIKPTKAKKLSKKAHNKKLSKALPISHFNDFEQEYIVQKTTVVFGAPTYNE
mmetsp:Transcript_63640/g.77842  ORF Transcript_63640/g.77842 Transcript_63640/m.77842 type:complete len:89 (+) Transcript_63640:327-593(+)